MRCSFIIASLIVSASSSPMALDSDLIATLNSMPNMTWVSGVNAKFDGMTLAETKRFMGTRRDAVRRAALPLGTLAALPASAIPTNFNATAAFPNCAVTIGHIRDQSDCGCCWAFGSTEAFNDRLCVAYNISVLLSPQDTCSCCNSDNGFSSGGCDGGYTEDAFNYFKTIGVVTGGDNTAVGTGASCYPFQLKECGHHEASPLIPCPQVCSPGECATPKCESTCTEKSYTKSFQKDKHFAKGGAFHISSIAQAQTEIMTHGPISAAFTVYNDFLTYTSGVYSHKSGAQLGGHAIKIYGWGTTDTGLDYWLAANSCVGWGIAKREA